MLDTMIQAVAGGIGIGNTTKLNDTEINTLNQIAEQKLTQSAIENSVASMVMKGASDAIKENATDIQAIIRQDNIMGLGQSADLIAALTEGLSPEGAEKVKLKLLDCPPVDFNVKGVKMSNKADVKAAATTKSETINNLSNKMRQNVQKQMESMQSKMENQNLGSTFDGVADIVGQTFQSLGDNMEAVVDGSMGGAGIGNNYEQNKVTENHKNLQNLFKIENLQELNQEDMKDMSLTNKFSEENVTTIIGEVLQANEFKANALCPGNINLEDVTLENLATMDVKSETLSKLVNEVGQDAHSNIDHLLANLQKFQSDKTVGDIQQLGTATSAMLVAGGEAVSTAAQGVGTGLSNVLGGNLIKYIMMGMVVVALIVGIVFIIRPKAASSTIQSVSSDVANSGNDDFGPTDDFGSTNDFGPTDDFGQPMDDMGFNTKHFTQYLN